MTDYTALLFHSGPTLASSYRQSDELLLADISRFFDKPDLKMTRVNYEDGTWSSWFELTSESADYADLKKLAEALSPMPGMETMKLRNAEGVSEFVQPVEQPPKLAYGARIPKKGPKGPKGP